jgi:hypothetical protein
MPRIPFEPGFEALAADMMILQDSGIIRYDTEEQRDADWPGPFQTALCYCTSSPDILYVRGASAWYPMVYNADSLSRQFIGSKLTPGLSDSTYPKQYELQIASSSLFVIYRRDAGTPTTQNIIAAASSSLTLDTPVPVGGYNAAHRMDAITAASAHVFSFAHPGDTTPRNWMYLGQDAARPTRAKLTLGGNVSADNIPVDLMERLANLETRLAEAEARLAIYDAPKLAPANIDTTTPPPPSIPPEPPPVDDSNESEG